MKKLLLTLSAITLVFAVSACKKDNGETKNNPNELTVTGDALDITDYTATLTGFANLPLDMGNAEVGIVYDKGKSFDAAIKVVASGLDGNNMFTVTATGLVPSTTYYFKSYAKNGLAIKYGAVKSFRTLPQRVTSITINKTSLTLLIGDETTLSVTSVLPENANDKSYTWSSSDNAIASVDKNGKVNAKSKGTATIKATANDGSGISASCTVFVCENNVDLGTKTAEGKTLYWAKTNLCMSGLCANPEDYGDYYAWGETEPYYYSQEPLSWKYGKSGYNWLSYKWCNGTYNSLTKYNTDCSRGAVDGITELQRAEKPGETIDDAVRAVLDGKWRMPTDSEWAELLEKCTWTLTDNYNGTGVAGIMVTAKNGNSIFLPAAGYRDGDMYVYNKGEAGYYWSSSLDTGYPVGAWSVFFTSERVDRNGGSRHYGFSIRPVYEE